ncbi:hypothetical protein [Natronomonas aquatica]|nr:hypothetical protein [Natronomonas aquatica]
MPGPERDPRTARLSPGGYHGIQREYLRRQEAFHRKGSFTG